MSGAISAATHGISRIFAKGQKECSGKQVDQSILGDGVAHTVSPLIQIYHR